MSFLGNHRLLAGSGASFLLATLMTLVSTKASASVTPVQLPPYEEHHLENGMRVVIAPRTELPLVSVRLLLETGAVDDPPQKAGLASFVSGLIKRGTTNRSADEIDGAIEFVGGSLDTGSGNTSTVVSGTVTSEHLPLAFELVADVTLHPSFPKDEFQIHKRRTIASLAQALDDPGTVADRAMLSTLLPPGHPYVPPPSGTRQSVSTFGLEDVRRFHRTYYAPGRATLIVVGDVTAKKVLELARSHYGEWRTKTPPQVEIPQLSPLKKNAIRIIHKEKATQVQIRFVGRSFSEKTDPVFFPAVVANTAFGGGFTSRLVDEIRVNRGLSYSVGTRLTQSRGAGFYSFRSFTKNETVGELLSVAVGEAAKAREKGFKREEIARAKSYVAGLYPLRLETNDQIAAALAEIYLYDLPRDWVETYRGKLVGAKPAQINRAAAEWFFAEPFAIVLVGDQKAIKKGLAEAGIKGEVQVIPIEEAE